MAPLNNRGNWRESDAVFTEYLPCARLLINIVSCIFKIVLKIAVVFSFLKMRSWSTEWQTLFPKVTPPAAGRTGIWIEAAWCYTPCSQVLQGWVGLARGWNARRPFVSLVGNPCKVPALSWVGRAAKFVESHSWHPQGFGLETEQQVGFSGHRHSWARHNTLLLKVWSVGQQLQLYLEVCLEMHEIRYGEYNQ